jgi:hypothetical protein
MMRQAARRTNPGRARVVTTSSQLAPVRGWNARDGIANMEAGFAVTLDNWFPLTAEIRMRKGSAEHVTDIMAGVDPAEVETLITYKPQSGAQSLWAWADDSIYNVTAAGGVGAAAVTGLTNARWQVVNFKTAGGDFLIAVNGEDELQLYNGTVWASIDGASVPSITNVLTTDLIHAFIFKERAFYIEVDSLTLWYAAAGAFAGALNSFPIRSYIQSGGYLMAAGSWTRDAGNGPDDFLVTITSEGEVVVYSGTDPASDFALVGVYRTGKPIGRRCLLKFAGDLLIITTDGVIPMSRLVSRERKEQGVAVTEIIQGAMADAVSAYSTNFGWELFLYSEASMLLLNVPVDTEQVQFVMNSFTKAWCRFTDWPANCFAELNGELYFGMAGEVRKAWTGVQDVDELVRAEAVFNFAYFGDRTSLKQTTLMRPIMRWDSAPASIKVGIDADFNVKAPTSDIVSVSSAGSTWDIAEWDEGFWGGEPVVQSNWLTACAIGYALSFHIVVEVTQTTWVSISSVDIAYKRGSTL